jgi:hypothetical protein
VKRSTFRRTVREGDRGEPQRTWVAWMEPVAGCVPALGTARLAKVSQNASELELSLRNMGLRVGRFSSQSKALAWLDDEKLRCSACSDGKGRWRCPSCQEGILVGQLEASVGGCCR